MTYPRLAVGAIGAALLAAAIWFAALSAFDASADNLTGANKVAIDLDTADNTPTAYGSILDCVVVPVNGTVEAAVIVDAIPVSNGVTGGIGGFGFNILYTQSIVRVTARATPLAAQDGKSLLTVNANSSITSFTSPLTDVDGDFQIVELDSAATYEAGPGTLYRLTFTGIANGTSPVTLSDTSGGDGDSVPDLYAADTSSYTIASVLHAQIIVGPGSCGGTPTPSPTPQPPTPSPTPQPPTPTPTPQPPTPSPTPQPPTPSPTPQPPTPSPTPQPPTPSPTPQPPTPSPTPQPPTPSPTPQPPTPTPTPQPPTPTPTLQGTPSGTATQPPTPTGSPVPTPTPTPTPPPPTPTPAGGVPAECAGMTFDTVLTGTSAADTIIGTQGRDLIFGLGGNDYLSGQNGNDCLVGGDGDDALKGEGNDDTLVAGAGVDYATGGFGNDRVHGGDGNDNLAGDAGNDTINGNNGNDYMAGGADTDNCDGGAGAGDSQSACEVVANVP